MELEKIREECGSWDEDIEWCGEEFPEECPYSKDCKLEAESDE